MEHLADTEYENLVAHLRQRGVDYLAPSDAMVSGPLDDAALLARLAACSDARLRQALIALFILRPELARHVAEVRRRLDAPAERTLLGHYLAAVYLQRMWSIRLERDLGRKHELPDLFSKELGLPPAADMHGKAGLHALVEWLSQSEPHPFNHLSEFEGVIDLVFSSLKLKKTRS